VARTTSGEFTVGNKTVPINQTITLQGGTVENPETGALTFVGAEDGNTLSKTALEVPGGLLGLMCGKVPSFLKGLCEQFAKSGFNTVTETTELAQPASNIAISTENLLAETGVALSLPVKVKVGNLFLGNKCYVGSESSPISLELTTGTTSPPEPNKPIKGSKGTLEFKDEFNLAILSGGSLVDNAFSTSGASGCGGIFSFLLNPVVNTVLGVPAPAGHNTAILNGTLEEANAEAVRASEK
jgi:hypothetical protein